MMNQWLAEIGRRTLIMGILNVTPDSFSDGGQYNSVDRAVAHAKRLVAEGADLLDIGGESTRPGATPVSEDEEIERVIPVIRALQAECKEIPLSIDTYKGEVARQALAAGAAMVNDIWGGKADPTLLQIVAERRVPIILMHNRPNMEYGADPVADVISDLRASIKLASDAGIHRKHILIDPGIGFAKNRELNLLLMNRLADLAELGYPVVLGTSRKRFIREVLAADVDQVLGGTIATTVLGIERGASIMRVHDVAENAKAAKMTDAILQTKTTGF
jgi:dihydropteroate synthase